MAVAPPTAISKDVGRMLTLLSRASRARSLYAANNQALLLMKQELVRSVETVFRQVDEVSLRVLPEELAYQDVTVFQDSESADSLPFILYRDGVRRIEFLRGLDGVELEHLLAALHQGTIGRSMEDDVVTQLWRHELEHVRYVTVEVHVTDAASEAAHEQQVDAVVRSLYSSAPEGTLFHGLNLDAHELAAKSLAEAMGTIDELAPGFRPASALPALPAYAGRLKTESDGASSYRRMATDILAMLVESEEDLQDASHGFTMLLDLLDAALLEEDLSLATDVVVGVRGLPRHGPLVSDWLQEALSDVRLRQVSSFVQQVPDLEDRVRAFFVAAGRRSAPSLVQALPTFKEPELRRRFADLALELGLDDTAAVEELVHNEIGFAAREGLYLLSRLDLLRDRSLLREIQRHPKPQVRLALVNEIDQVPDDIAPSVLSELLRDESARVRVAAAETLTQRGDEMARRALLNAIERPEFDDEPESVKRACALGVATVLGPRAVTHLEPLVQRADGWMARKAQEESAAAAIAALAQVQHQEAVEALKRAALSRNRAVRSEARQALERMRGGAA
jgi:hypothetical protein